LGFFDFFRPRRPLEVLNFSRQQNNQFFTHSPLTRRFFPRNPLSPGFIFFPNCFPSHMGSGSLGRPNDYPYIRPRASSVAFDSSQLLGRLDLIFFVSDVMARDVLFPAFFSDLPPSLHQTMSWLLVRISPGSMFSIFAIVLHVAGRQELTVDHPFCHSVRLLTSFCHPPSSPGIG